MSATPSPETTPSEKSVEAALQQKVAQGTLQPDKAQVRVARALDLLREELIEEYEGRHFLKRQVNKLKFGYKRRHAQHGLYLWGSPGSGKSMLMDMFLRCVETSPALASLTRRRTHFLPFMAETHAAIERLNRSRVRDPVAKLATRIVQESRLLCFDEFVVEDIADAMLLGHLSAALTQQGAVLVATSNFAPEDLYKDGLKRDNFLPFLNLLRQAVVVVHVCNRIDYRSRALARQGKSLWFTGTTGKKRMQETFSRFTKKQNENIPLPCEGRAILLQRTGTPSEALRAKRLTQEVVWCSFQDLCRTPRGVRDYNALLAYCSLLFLADFPVLDETQRNGAKRLMRLVDLFYEQRAIVLCHSPALSPQALYSGESHKKEFRRTVSRLEEMLASAHALL